MFKKKPFIFALAVLPAVFLATAAIGQTIPIPGINLQVGQASNPDQVASALQVIVLLTVLSLAPAILVLTTSFTRIIIVFSLLRSALGTQQSPPNQILTGLAMFLTFFIMAPVWQDVNEKALQPYLSRQITQNQALDRSSASIKKFMSRFTREKDLALFVKISKMKAPRTINDVPLWVLIPAYVISELKTAFLIGFVIYVPFLVIDMIISSILMAMGMMMLPPVMISLPIKLMLFVLVDGWYLLVGSLVKSFTGNL